MKLAVSWVPWVAEVLVFLGFMFGVGLAGAQVSLCPKAAVPEIRSENDSGPGW